MSGHLNIVAAFQPHIWHKKKILSCKCPPNFSVKNPPPIRVENPDQLQNEMIFPDEWNTNQIQFLN